ncbi:hypothetical protein D3C85_1442150 [compost metagenome]
MAYAPEHRIAAIMAVAVVDLLEEIQIQCHDTERLPVTLSQATGALGPFVEAAPIG